MIFSIFLFQYLFSCFVGTCRWHRDGPLGVVQWKDRDVVTCMSTCHPGHRTGSAIRYVKQPVGGKRRIRVPRPEAIGDYNTHMGGVDKADQMMKYYEILHKSLKYWKKLFLHLVDMSVFMLSSCSQLCANTAQRTSNSNGEGATPR